MDLKGSYCVFMTVSVDTILSLILKGSDDGLLQFKVCAFGLCPSSDIKNTQCFDGWLCPRLHVWVMGTPTLLGPMDQANIKVQGI
jgi:hypothetical protein